MEITQRLNEARQSLQAFEQNKSSKDLQRAVYAMMGASSTATGISQLPAELRRQIVLGWLNFFAALDQDLDPSYDWSDPKNIVSLNLVPPGGKYPSGVDPKSIQEPDVRAQYEEALAENRRRAVHVNTQTTLRNIEREAIVGMQIIFLPSAYPAKAGQGSEWSDAVNRSSLSPARKDQLRALLKQE